MRIQRETDLIRMLMVGLESGVDIEVLRTFLTAKR
jgi:hypothetical protein